jgi:[acyl-carrier-protein] S-malonyltransferase
VTGQLHSDWELKNKLVQQIISPVRWQSIMENMMEHGVTTFIEVGPGNVLAGLLRKTAEAKDFAVRIYSISNSEQIAQLIKELL